MSRHSLPCQSSGFPTWYAEVVRRAGLVGTSILRGPGNRVGRPRDLGGDPGALDDRIGASGHENLYFPLIRRTSGNFPCAYGGRSPPHII